MKFCKIREVQTPQVGTEHSAGIDFFVPFMSREFQKVLRNHNTYNKINILDEDVVVLPGCRITIPSGIKVIIDEGEALIAFNKSGVSSKTGLVLSACVVDSDYRGEVMMSLINTSNVPVSINYGQKILQFVKIDYKKHDLEELLEDEYEEYCDTERGSGGFGSTGE